MCDLSQDILQEIPNDDLPLLAKIYEKPVNFQSAPYVFSFIHNVIRWKKNAKYWKDNITIMSPQRSSHDGLMWQEDGTIIILMQNYGYHIFVFTLNDNCNTLYRSLIESKRINWKKEIVFFVVNENHLPTINKIITEKSLQHEDDNEHTFVMFTLEIDKARNLEIQCPPEVEIRELERKHADIINNVWPHRYPESDKYLATLIEDNGGYGLFLKGTDCLVSWILRHVMNHLGMLQTLDDYKGRGYGALILTVLCRELGEEGFKPFGTVMQNNTPSIKLFTKLGFKDIGRCTFVNLNAQES